MKQKRTFITLLLVIALLCLGIAYAAIDAQTLTISGTASATASDENFEVKFSDVEEDTTTENNGFTVTAEVTGDTTASIICSGLSNKDDSVSATYTVVNASPELRAAVTAAVTSTNDKFTVTTDWADSAKTIDANNGETTITVTVTLNETVAEDVNEEPVEVTLTANPLEPAA